MLKIGVPSKGRLMEKTFDWFGAHGVTMSRTGNEREYSGAVEGIAGVELVLWRSPDGWRARAGCSRAASRCRRRSAIRASST